jgi:hypothetical protein
MNSFVEHLRDVERSLTAERGAFSLFALFLREDSPGKWDVVVSAPWIGSDLEGALRLMSMKVKVSLKLSEQLAISRVVIVEPDSAEVLAINAAYVIENSVEEVRDAIFFGLAIKRAYILSSVRQEPSVSVKVAQKKVSQRGRGASAQR